MTPGAAAQDVDRLSGSIGARWKAWQAASGPINAVTLHASLGYTFQPAQIDFGPDPEAKPEGGGLLVPETQRSVVAGLKADTPGGLAGFDIDGFFVDFYNQPIQATSGGIAVLRSVGEQRHKGVDVEGALRPAKDWTIKANLTGAMPVTGLSHRYQWPADAVGGHAPGAHAGNARQWRLVFAPDAVGAARSLQTGWAVTGRTA